MATTRDDLKAALAVQDRDALRLILHASGIDLKGAETAAELAERVAEAIWWNYSTPLGYVTEQSTLEDIAGNVARRLGVAGQVDAATPAWAQLSALTAALVPAVPTDGISADALDDATRARLSGSWAPALGWGGGAVSSFAARWTSAKVVALLKTPIGRLLPLIPVVGPWIGTIGWGAVAVKAVTGPLGLALSVVSLNASLGSNYRRLVPLLLGVGALAPQPVEDAWVVAAGAPQPA